MTPQELKNSILQLAIQGRLVEQRPEEGTAEELYQEIQKEKRRLIKEGKIKKEKPLPEITEDEKPFEIPESWKWVRIGNLFQHNTGKALNSSNKSGKLYEYITTSNVYWNRFELDKLKTMLFTDDELVRCSVQKGDLLVLEGGDVGRAAVWNYDFPMRIQNHIHRMRSYGKTCIEYFYNIFFFYKNVGLINGKGIGIQGLSSNALHALVVPLPPLAEQRRIVAKIEELSLYVDRYEQAWNRLEELNKRFPADMQKSLLQLAIEGKLVEQRPEEGTSEELYQEIQEEKQRLIKTGKLKKNKTLPKITTTDIPAEFPENWKVCYMDDIAFVTKLAGFEYTKSIAPNLIASGIPLFKGKNVQNGKLVLRFESFIPEEISDSLPRSQICKKCLLTPYVGSIGNIAIFDGNFKAHLGSNVGKIELLQDAQQYILEEYVLYYLKSNIGYHELTKYKKATAQESISIDAIRNVIIAIPPLAEQKRIVARLDELLPLCEKLK